MLITYISVREIHSDLINSKKYVTMCLSGLQCVIKYVTMFNDQMGHGKYKKKHPLKRTRRQHNARRRPGYDISGSVRIHGKPVSRKPSKHCVEYFGEKFH